MCPQATLRSLKESLEGGGAVLVMVMCGHVWLCVVVCLLVIHGSISSSKFVGFFSGCEN